MAILILYTFLKISYYLCKIGETKKQNSQKNTNFIRYKFFRTEILAKIVINELIKLNLNCYNNSVLCTLTLHMIAYDLTIFYSISTFALRPCFTHISLIFNNIARNVRRRDDEVP